MGFITQMGVQMTG